MGRALRHLSGSATFRQKREIPRQLLVDGTSVASGSVVSGTGGVSIAGFKAAHNEWHNIALQVVERKVTAYLDGTLLTTYTDAKPRLSGTQWQWWRHRYRGAGSKLAKPAPRASARFCLVFRVAETTSRFGCDGQTTKLP